MVSDIGEDLILHCKSCHYAANVETATGVIAPKKMDVPPADFHPSSFFDMYKYVARVKER